MRVGTVWVTMPDGSQRAFPVEGEREVGGGLRWNSWIPLIDGEDSTEVDEVPS